MGEELCCDELEEAVIFGMVERTRGEGEFYVMTPAGRLILAHCPCRGEQLAEGE